LKNRDADIRKRAAEGLGKLGPAAPEEAVRELRGAVKDDDDGVRRGAIVALGQIGPGAKDAVPALILALDDDNASVRSATAEALGKIGQEAVPALIKAVDADRPRIRVGALQALGFAGPAAHAAIPKLISTLSDPEVRKEAIRALAGIGKDAVVPLTKALGNEDEDIRHGAAMALGYIGAAAKDAVAALTTLSEDDPSAKVRDAARLALRRIQRQQ
jgi:HEAT repeat protein